MALVGEIVAASLRVLRVIDPDQNPEPRQYQTAIDAMNRMLARWEADTLSLGWVPVSAPDEEFPVSARAESAVIYNLAVMLRAEYGVPIDPDVIGMAREEKAGLWADLTRETDSRLTLEIPDSESYSDRFRFFAG